MFLNPILVQFRRGGLVESVHRGAYVVIEQGKLLESRGDIDRPVFPRSALKPFQALPLLMTGAADRFGLTEEEIVVTAASHNGTDDHVRIVRSLLEKGGLEPGHLQCGPHAPAGSKARRTLITRGESFSSLHNNCSGKHAGMLLLARHLGAKLGDYLHLEHPVQQSIRRTLSEYTGVVKERLHVGCDGCNAPTYAFPLRALATGYHRLVGASASAEARRLVAAIQRFPDVLAGPGRFCTVLANAAPGRFLPKSGAEGVYAVGVPDRGLALSIKIDDGNERGYFPVVANILNRVGLLDREELARLGRFGQSELHNWRGTTVGEVLVTEAETGAEAS